jgi:hypothetical protein
MQDIGDFGPLVKGLPYDQESLKNASPYILYLFVVDFQAVLRSKIVNHEISFGPLISHGCNCSADCLGPV